MHPVKKLKSKKERDESGLFIIEGDKFVREIPSGWKVRAYYFSQSYADANGISFFSQRASCEILRDSFFESLSSTATPQGVLAVCEQKRFTPDGVIKENCFLVLGENLSDPGNIGTLIRTAAAAGADGVILSRGSAELWNPKLLRASAGAALRIPVVTDAEVSDTAARLKRGGVSIYAAHPRGEVLPYDLNLKKSFCLMIGSEAHGLTPEASALADALVTLPMPGQTESLNASVAGGVLMYEAVRQRLKSVTISDIT